MRSMRLREKILLASLTAIASVFPQFASAKPLDAEICKNLIAQRDELDLKGIGQIVSGGPSAGTVTPQQLASVRQYLEIQGQLRFRCPFDQALAPLKDDVPEEPEAGPAAAATDAKTAPTATTKPKPAAKKPARSTKAERNKSATAKTEGKSEASAPDPQAATPAQAARPAKAAAKAKSAAKPKDDAYRPPETAVPDASTLDSQAKRLN